MSGCRLYVANLHPDVDESTIAQVFQHQTGVLPENIILRTNYALVDLPNGAPYDKVIETLNGMLRVFLISKEKCGQFIMARNDLIFCFC